MFPQCCLETLSGSCRVWQLLDPAKSVLSPSLRWSKRSRNELEGDHASLCQLQLNHLHSSQNFGQEAKYTHLPSGIKEELLYRKARMGKKIQLKWDQKCAQWWARSPYSETGLGSNPPCARALMEFIISMSTLSSCSFKFFFCFFILN